MGDDMENDSKPCPACGETIRKAAIKCRHCGEQLKQQPQARGQEARAMEDAANMSMILGIVGLVVCAFTGPFAIMKANEAKRLAQRARLPVSGAATAGLVLGWIATILLILSVLITVGMFVLILVAGVAGGR